MFRARSMGRYASRLALLGALGLSLFVVPATVGAQDAPATDAPTANAKQRLQVAKDGLIRNIWWNQDAVVQKLGLEAGQRTAMDDQFHRFLDDMEVKQNRARASREGFADALKAGRWEEARRNIRQLGISTNSVVTSQPSLKVEVLSLLSTEQLAIFNSEYSHLYQRPWFRQLSLGAGGKRQGPRNRTMSGGKPARAGQTDDGQADDSQADEPAGGS